MRGISQFIATVLLVVTAVTVGGIILLWATGLMQQQASSTGTQAQQEIECRKAGIRILDDTIKCNFTGTEYLNFSLENTGYTEMYNFTAQLYVGGVVHTYDIFEAVTNRSFTKDYPLKIGDVKTVFVNVTEDLPAGTLRWLRIATRCPLVSDMVENVTC